MSKLILLIYIWLIPTIVFANEPVGVILPMTGDFARYGSKIQASLVGTKSPQVQYIFEDEGCFPQKAITAYKKLSSVDGVRLFLGPWCGSPQSVVAPLLVGANQISILGSSAPRSVYKLSEGRMFSTQHTIEQESHFVARKAYQIGARKVVIVFFDNDFSRAHEAAFRDEYKGEVLDTLSYTSADASILKSLVVRIKKLAPDTLYVPDAFPLLHGLLRELAQIGLQDLRIISVYSAQSQSVLEAIGSYGEGLLYSYPKIEDRVALEYFPAKAAEVVNRIVNECGSADTDCALKLLKDQYKFNSDGVLEGEIGLKVVRDGAFQWYQ